METNFFGQVAGMKLSGSLRMNIQVSEDNRVTVSVLAIGDTTDKKVEKKIPPLVLSGTISELNSQFFDAITTPLQTSQGLLRNLKQHEQATQNAIKDAAQKPASVAAKSSKRQKFDEQIKKVNDLEKQNKIGQAIAQMPDAKTYPEYSQEINTKMQQLRSKHGSLSLFDPIPAANTTADEPGNSPDENEEEEETEEEDAEPEDVEDEYDPNR